MIREQSGEITQTAMQQVKQAGCSLSTAPQNEIVKVWMAKGHVVGAMWHLCFMHSEDVFYAH